MIKQTGIGGGGPLIIAAEPEPVMKMIKPVPNTDLVENFKFNLYAISVNNQIAIAVDDADPDVTEKMMRREGFQFIGPYAWAHLSNRVKMRTLREYVERKIRLGDIHLPSKSLDDLRYMHDTWERAGRARAQLVRMLDPMQMRNFYLMRIRRPKNPDTVNIYMIIEDDEPFVIVDLKMAPRKGYRFIARKIKNIEWTIDDGAWMAFFRKKSDALTFAENLANKYTIGNYSQFEEEMDALVIRKLNVDVQGEIE